MVTVEVVVDTVVSKTSYSRVSLVGFFSFTGDISNPSVIRMDDNYVVLNGLQRVNTTGTENTFGDPCNIRGRQESVPVIS